MSDDDEYNIGRRVAMRDKELEERAMQPTGPKLRVCRYRLGESRIFDSIDDVPEGQGWVDSPAKVRPMPQIQPAVAVSVPPLAPQPKIETPASDAPKRSGRKTKVTF